jgi:ABC-2 type transport system permease protein
MAVYKRSYRGYTGNLTPRWSRFLILKRYASRSVFRSRFVTALFVICFFFPVVMIAGLYLNHNAHVLSLLKMNRSQLWEVNGAFFMTFMGFQSAMAFIMTAFIGPGMIAPDLANNALPLYFCRPVSRTEYVLGRGFSIVSLLSWITWVPGLVLFFIEATLSGFSWAWQHWNYAVGIVFGSMLWILVLTLMALALSAWVRWRIVAGGLLLGVMGFTSGFAAAVNQIVRTKAGFYLDPAALVTAVYSHFFDVTSLQSDIPTGNALLALAAICGFCIFLLSRKVRAFEVVR